MGSWIGSFQRTAALPVRPGSPWPPRRTQKASRPSRPILRFGPPPSQPRLSGSGFLEPARLHVTDHPWHRGIWPGDVCGPSSAHGTARSADSAAERCARPMANRWLGSAPRCNAPSREPPRQRAEDQTPPPRPNPRPSSGSPKSAARTCPGADRLSSSVPGGEVDSGVIRTAQVYLF